MNAAVSDEVLKRTTRCKKNFTCQKPDWEPCGCVTEVIGKVVLSLEGRECEGKSCSYHVAYGDDNYCTCPARVDIYSRYGR